MTTVAAQKQCQLGDAVCRDAETVVQLPVATRNSPGSSPTSAVTYKQSYCIRCHISDQGACGCAAELVCPAGSDCSALNDNISAGPGSLNFQRMVYALTVEQGGLLQLQNIVLYGSAARSDYVYAPEQPYRLALVDSDMWPTIGMAPGAKLRLVNVTISYWCGDSKPSCLQFTMLNILHEDCPSMISVNRIVICRSSFKHKAS